LPRGILLPVWLARAPPSWAIKKGPGMTKPIPEGWHSVTPRLVVHDAGALVEFLKHAFGATGDFRRDGPSEIRIGDSRVLVSSVGPRDAMPAFLYLYVDDSDATYRRALEAGATSLEAPRDTPYGDRRGMVEDPCGNVWQIATHMEDVPLDDVRKCTAATPSS
jgi:PhnB protein